MSGLVARCPVCGARVPEEASRCGACGRSLADDVVVLEEGAPDEPVAAPVPRRRRQVGLLAAVAVVLAVLVRAVVVDNGSPAPPAEDQALPEFHDPSGAKLLALVDGGLVLVDVDRDVVLPVDLPAVGRPSAVVERRGAVVVVSGGRGWALQGSGRLTDLGPADGAFASEDHDRVWLADAVGVREVTLGGVLVRPAMNLPATAVAGGGLIVNASGGVQVHDPDTGELLRRVGDLAPMVDAAGRWVVTADREELRCDVEVVDATDATVFRVRLLPYRLCLQGRSAMSADGRRLVVPVAEYVQGAGTRNGTLVVVDLVTRRALRVPRTQRAVPLFSSPTWSPSGRWLFWVDPVGPQPIGAYRVAGEGAVAVRPQGLGFERVRGLWAVSG